MRQSKESHSPERGSQLRRAGDRWKARLRRYWFLPLFVLLPLAFDLGFFAAGLLPQSRSVDQVAPVDLIVVLTGGQGRLKEAVQFLQNGRGRYLFVSGTAPKAQLLDILKANKIETLSDAIYAKILLGDESRTTQENAIEIRKIVESLQAHSILLVTSNYHMKRALHLIQEEFNREPRLTVIVTGYPVESPNFDQDSWWRSFTGWRILVSEYAKSWALHF